MTPEEQRFNSFVKVAEEHSKKQWGVGATTDIMELTLLRLIGYPSVPEQCKMFHRNGVTNGFIAQFKTPYGISNHAFVSDITKLAKQHNITAQTPPKSSKHNFALELVIPYSFVQTENRADAPLNRAFQNTLQDILGDKKRLDFFVQWQTFAQAQTGWTPTIKAINHVIAQFCQWASPHISEDNFWLAMAIKVSGQQLKSYRARTIEVGIDSWPNITLHCKDGEGQEEKIAVSRTQVVQAIGLHLEHQDELKKDIESTLEFAARLHSLEHYYRHMNKDELYQTLLLCLDTSTMRIARGIDYTELVDKLWAYACQNYYDDDVDSTSRRSRMEVLSGVLCEIAVSESIDTTTLEKIQQVLVDSFNLPKLQEVAKDVTVPPQEQVLPPQHASEHTDEPAEPSENVGKRDNVVTEPPAQPERVLQELAEQLQGREEALRKREQNLMEEKQALEEQRLQQQTQNQDLDTRAATLLEKETQLNEWEQRLKQFNHELREQSSRQSKQELVQQERELELAKREQHLKKTTQQQCLAPQVQQRQTTDATTMLAATPFFGSSKPPSPSQMAALPSDQQNATLSSDEGDDLYSSDLTP